MSLPLDHYLSFLLGWNPITIQNTKVGNGTLLFGLVPYILVHTNHKVVEEFVFVVFTFGN
jgi:hypothetical protein